MTILPEDVIAQIADVVDQRIEVHLEQLRQGLYTNVKQLVLNQQELATMLAQHNNPEAMIMLAHGMWERSVLAEADRIRTSMQAEVTWQGDITERSSEQPQAEFEVSDAERVDLFAMDDTDEWAQGPEPEPKTSLLDSFTGGMPESIDEPEPAVKPRMVLCPNRIQWDNGGMIVHPPECPMCGGKGKVPENASV